MKHAIFHSLLGIVLLTMPFHVQSQAPAAYQVPDTYQFNYEVAQQVTSDNPNAGGPKSITFIIRRAVSIPPSGPRVKPICS
jgi:hypothetical protein